MSVWHSQKTGAVTDSLGVNPDVGLSNEEAAQRLAKGGPNRLVVEQEIRFLAILKEEVTEPMILLLFGVGILYGILDPNITDALTILFVVTVLVLLKFGTNTALKTQ